MTTSWSEVVRRGHDRNTKQKRSPPIPPRPVCPKLTAEDREQLYQTLADELELVGMEVRLDSYVCRQFLNGYSTSSARAVADTMCFLRYLHEYTPYVQLRESYGATYYAENGRPGLPQHINGQARTEALRVAPVPSEGKWPWLNYRPEEDADAEEDEEDEECLPALEETDAEDAVLAQTVESEIEAITAKAIKELRIDVEEEGDAEETVVPAKPKHGPSWAEEVEQDEVLAACE
jgi:hypothetical protein